MLCVVGQTVAVGTEKHALVLLYNIIQSSPIPAGESPVMTDAAHHHRQ